MLFLAGSMMTAALAQSTWVNAVSANYNRYKTYFLDTAEVMPEADYAYKLTPAQRPFSAWIGHTAMANYGACAGMKGEATPAVAKGLDELTKKAEISQALKDSFAYCDDVFKSMTDQQATMELKIGERKVVPAVLMVNLVGTLNEHYGNLVGYMRTKGITPPSTARAQKKNAK
ncbi:MAG: DinB family protein [Bryobacteraceae bacterium]